MLLLKLFSILLWNLEVERIRDTNLDAITNQRILSWLNIVSFCYTEMYKAMKYDKTQTLTNQVAAWLDGIDMFVEPETYIQLMEEANRLIGKN